MRRENELSVVRVGMGITEKSNHILEGQWMEAGIELIDNDSVSVLKNVEYGASQLK